jgi:hypothetical protein
VTTAVTTGRPFCPADVKQLCLPLLLLLLLLLFWTEPASSAGRGMAAVMDLPDLKPLLSALPRTTASLLLLLLLLPLPLDSLRLVPARILLSLTGTGRLMLRDDRVRRRSFCSFSLRCCSSSWKCIRSNRSDGNCA